MKKTVKQIVCAVIALTVFAFLCVFASAASIESIKVKTTENGTVEVITALNDGTKAIITLTPDEGYIAAEVNLRAKNGASVALTRVGANVYTCDIPDTECTLSTQFRTARVALNKTELAMKSGESFTATATLTCTDGEIYTRDNIIDRDIVFASTNPEVVSIDSKTGVMTAHEMGYARITASAAAGNKVEGYFYVIVDGDKSPVVGTIQLNAHFDEKLFVDIFLPGHCFLVFTNTSGNAITINTEGFYHCDVPTEKYYENVNEYDGIGYDPLTFYYATDGEYQNEDNAAVRKEYAEGFFTRYERGALSIYEIQPNDIVTFGNTGELFGFEGGNFTEILERYGKSFELRKIVTELVTGRINAEKYLYRVAELVNEILYDSSTGYNPFNANDGAGECLNHELYEQVYERDYTDAASCKTEITKIQLEAMVDYIQYGDALYGNYFAGLERNCSAVACGGWNLVTAAKPQYHMVPNVGGITTAFAAPLWLRNTILAKAVLLAGDSDIEFTNGIEVVKPAKNLGIACEHAFVNGKCTVCGVTDINYKPIINISNIFARVFAAIRNMLSGIFAWLPFVKN